MKFTINNNTIMEHVMLSSPRGVAIQIADTPLWKECDLVEAKLTMNGVDVPVEVLEKVLQNMWEQCKEETGVNDFKRKVKEEAERIVQDKANTLLEAFGNIQDKLSEANDLIKWEWE